MENAKVSIIIPVYNVEEYLVKCLESVRNQTLQDIEIICVNDGSTDNSYEILKNYAKLDKRIILVDKENEGTSIARNIGMQYTRGEYILFLDSDDWLHEKTCELVYNKAKADNSDLVVFKLVNVSPQAVIPHNFANSLNNISPFYFNDAIDDYFYILTSAGGKLYKNTKQKFYSNIFKGEDTLFYWQYCLKNNPKISILDEPLYYYLSRNNSTMNNYDYINEFKIQDSYQELISLDEFTNASKEIQIKILDRYAQSIDWEITCLTRKNLPILKNYIDNVENFLSLFEQYDKQLKNNLRFYSNLKRKIYDFKPQRIKSLGQKLFSVKNRDNHKVFKILGIKFKFRYIKGEAGKENLYIKKLIKNSKKYTRDSYLLFDCLHDNTTECIDAYSLFLSMREQNLKAYYVLLKDTSLYRKLEAENDLENIIPLEHSSRQFHGEFIKTIYEQLLRTKAVITSFGENSPKINKFFKEFPHWQYIFIQHGPTFMKESVMYNGYLYPSKFDKVLICSEQERKIFNKYGWQDEQLIQCGLPRWDLLNNLEPTNEKSILVMFTWRKLNILQFENSQYKQNILKFLNNPKLQKLLQNNNTTLYFAHHHALAKNNGIDFKIVETPNIKIIDNTEISKYIKQSSCLITDFSSVAFDFMFQNKPVLHYLLDAKDRNLNKYESKDIERFEYKRFILPNVFYTEDEVLDKLKFYIENDFTPELEFLSQYNKFFYTQKDIRKKILLFLEQLI